MKILAFAGSNSKHSINKKLVEFTVQHFFSNAEVTLIDLNDYEVPIYSIDREKERGIPEKVKNFVSLFENHDVVVISLAEHNGTYTVAFKNIMDWSSRYKLDFFNNRPVLLMATSPGGYGGGNVLEAAQKRLPKFKAAIKSSFSLPKFSENFDVETGIINQEKLEELRKAVQTLS